MSNIWDAFDDEPVITAPKPEPVQKTDTERPDPSQFERFITNRPAAVPKAYGWALMLTAIASLPVTGFFLLTLLMTDVPLGWLSVLFVPGTVWMYIAGRQIKRDPSKAPERFQFRYRDPEELPSYYRLSRVHGTPGNLDSARGKFSDANIAAGEAGEQRTAVLLDELAEIPGVRVFHGLSWPGTGNADIDHVVLAGDRLAVIDSKMWAGVRHTMGADAQVRTLLENGEEMDRKVGIHRSVMAITGGNRSVTARAYLAVHSSPQTQFVTASEAPVFMASAEDAVAEVKKFILGANFLGSIRTNDIDFLRMLIPSPLEAQDLNITPDSDFSGWADTSDDPAHH